MRKLANMPSWLETLIVKALKDFIPASAVAEAIESFKVELFSRLEALAASTDNTVDDAIVAKVKEIFNSCPVDYQFLCDLIEKGEDAVIEFLRGVAAKSPTKIDDAAVEILAKALKS